MLIFVHNYHIKISLFIKKRYLENKILHSSDAYSKSNKRRPKDICEGNVSIKRNVSRCMRLLQDPMKSIQIIDKLR